jgi:hypothetical protein
MSKARQQEIHKDRLAAKYEKLEGLRALYAEWEPHLPEFDEYMRHLRERIRKCECQLKNMRP